MADAVLNPLHVILTLAVTVLLIQLYRKLQQRSPYPPGPRGLPLIGNVLDMPTSHEWRRFAEWGEKYGDIVYLNLLGQPMVILNSAPHASALLDKRGDVYSDRPVLAMSGELVGWSRSLVLLPYGERFRTYRRYIARWIGGHAQVARHVGLTEREADRLLLRLRDEPKDFRAHVRKFVGAIVLNITYGYDVREGADPIVEAVDRATDQFSAITSPGAFLVDVFPVLRYLPSWVPGARFKKQLPEYRRTIDAMADLPFDFVKAQMAKQIDTPSLTSLLLRTEMQTEQNEFNIKWAATSLYGGGADTTVSAIDSFFLAMTLYPDVQRRAQAEIDAVVGPQRLPISADRANLPYIEALIKEVLRWNPVAPLGVAHRVTRDDFYEGYLIPKNTLVIANIWKILHDPDVYLDPFAFNPSRYLAAQTTPVAPDPKLFVFGFGRRICPGMHLADATLFITCARVLATFTISKAVENGQVLTPEPEYTSGTISHPKPFKCKIEPRSGVAKNIA
ncbi:cytochrome P450 [Phanerochaete sordida]|uniref:Cytochrome P450 n=1 Tax=Phanerochaete sordida TaxID=48140 RepID=A0A9P3G278_9APHY|nr:cytochrome P450 [Phanerochaete sordida]